MWNGFNVLPTGHLITYSLNITKTTLIEDAITAINFYFPSGTVLNNSNISFLSVQNTIFNRNKTAVKIENLQTGNTNLNTAYSFFVGGSLITSRRLPFTAGSLIWPSISSVKVLKNPATASLLEKVPNSLSSPFINDNLYPDNVPEAYLKDGMGNNKPDYGIVFRKIASLDNSNGIWFSRSAENYTNSILVEEELARSGNYFNLFDNLKIGILADEASIQVRNCVFQKPAESGPFIGVEILNASRNKITIGELQTSGVTITNALRPNSNTFFDLNVAIRSTANCPNLVVNNSVFRSGRTPNSPSYFGNIGILNVGNFAILKIENNEFTNLRSGMLLSDNVNNLIGASGIVEINYNTIQSTHPDITPLGTESFSSGIIYGMVNTMPSGLSIYNPVNCSYNNLKGVSFGINFNNVNGKPFNISNNIISVADNGVNSQSKYGISLDGGNPFKNGLVENNTITGDCISCNESGIYLSYQSKTKIGCNNIGGLTVGGLTNGFRFLGVNPTTKFWDNMMNPTNKFGFTLEAGGIIGRQGSLRSFPTTFDACTSNNSWGAPVSTWNSLGHFMTNVINSNASNSQLIVNNNIWMNPNGSGVSLSPLFPPYQTNANGTGSLMISNDDPGCSRCTWTNPITVYGRFGISEKDEELDLKIADGTIDIPFEDADQRLYVLKEKLYETLMNDKALILQFPAFQDFVESNSWGSFDFIYYTAQYLAHGDIKSVDELLKYFPSTNVVDDNYWQYYKWLNEMQKSDEYKPKLDDVFSMANLCPAIHGNVVFAARSFYMLLKGEFYNFENTCENVLYGRLSNYKKLDRDVVPTELKNRIQIYPNPSTGIVNIKLPIFNDGNYNIIITDFYGKIVEQKHLKYSTFITQYNFTYKTGVYFIKITNTKTGDAQIGKIIIH